MKKRLPRYPSENISWVLEGAKAEEDDLPGDTTSVYNDYIAPVPRTSVISTSERLFLRAFRAFYDLAAFLQSLGNWGKEVTSSSATSPDNTEKVLSVRNSLEHFYLPPLSVHRVFQH